MTDPCLTLCSDAGGTCSDAEHKLFSVIFSNYNQYIRPVENVSDPVIVQFEVSMSQLVKVVSIACKGFFAVSETSACICLKVPVIYGAATSPHVNMYHSPMSGHDLREKARSNIKK